MMAAPALSKHILIKENCVRITSAGDCVRVDSDGTEYVLNEWYQDCPEGATEDNPEGCYPGIFSDFPEYDFDENVSSSEMNAASSNSGGGDTVVTESGDLKGSTVAAIGTGVVGITAVATQLLNLLAGAGASASSPVSASSSTAAVSTAAKKDEGFSLDAFNDGATGIAAGAAEKMALKGTSSEMRSNAYSKVLDAANKLSDYNALKKEGYGSLEAFGISVAQNEAAGAVLSLADNAGNAYLGTLEGIAKVFTPPSFHGVLPSSLVKDYVKAGANLGMGVYDGFHDAMEEFRNTGSIVDAAREFSSTASENISEFGENVAQGKMGRVLQSYADISSFAGEVTGVFESKGIVGGLDHYYAEFKTITDNNIVGKVLEDTIESLTKEVRQTHGPLRGILETAEMAGHVTGTIESRGLVAGTMEIMDNLSADYELIKKTVGTDALVDGMVDSAEKATGTVGSGVKEASALLGEYVGRGNGVVGGAKAFASDCGMILKNLWGSWK